MERLFYSLIFLFAILSFQTTSFSQSFTLLKDIHYNNPGTSQIGVPQYLTFSNGVLYFAGPNKGLWKSDGTEAGTSMIIAHDINMNISSMLDVDGKLFYTVTKPGLAELWTSDGTAGGTLKLNSWATQVLRNLYNVNGQLFLTAFFTNSNEELWKSDGTIAGTQLVKALHSPHYFAVLNGTLFFIEDPAPTFTPALWKSDGTEGGTMQVKGGLNFYSLYSTGQELYFTADDQTHGQELWKSDGTEAGTMIVKDITPGGVGSSIFNFCHANGFLYFFANTPANGFALWRSDGTDAGTFIVKDLPNSDPPNSLINVNGTLFFSGYDAALNYELWKSDGTEAGTVMVKDINSGAMGSHPAVLAHLNGTLYFMAGNSSDGVQTINYEIWKSDGTEAGTVMVKDIYQGSGSASPTGIVAGNNIIYFVATDGLTGREIWKSDGTTATLIANVFTPTGTSNARNLTISNGYVFFSASFPGAANGGDGDELYKTDGTISGTNRVANIYPVGGNSFPNQLTNMNNVLYFSAQNGSHGYELYASNGTEAGTFMIKDINPYFSGGDRGSYPSNLTPVNGTLFFAANNRDNGIELWKSDGTAAGTIIVKDIITGTTGSNPTNLVNVNGLLFFVSDNGTDGKELWKSDGTDAGTVMIKNIHPAGSSDPTSLTAMNGKLYFVADDGINGKELWVSDGTAAGTVIVKDIHTTSSSNPLYLYNMNGVLYFSATDGAGNELWKSDGTAAGTVLVVDINPAGNSDPSGFKAVNGRLYFAANDGTGGNELWKTDGTVAGTVLVKDINNGANGSNPSVLTDINNQLLFVADDGIHGKEVWYSDGTSAGTRLAQDFIAGSTGSNPTEIIQYNSKVITSLNTTEFGIELWIADVPAGSTLPLEFIEFKGKIINNDGLLQWKTENENNTSSFIIERSLDGSSYQSVGSVSAANTPDIHYYDFADVNITSLGVNKIYYRLKQTDIDGRFTYSNIVVLSIDNSSRPIVMLYPNPTKDNLNMTITISQSERLQWQLTDNSGRIVKSGNYNLSTGSTAVSIDISNLSSGMYVMQLNRTTIKDVFKVIKQ